LSQHFFYRVFYQWVRHIFDADVLHLNVHVKKLDKPVIIIANHISAWDPFLIFSILNRKFILRNLVWRLPAAPNQFTSLYQRIFFKLIGVYKIESKGNLSKSLEETFDIIDSGSNTMFFPEGKLVGSAENTKPKKGVSYIIEKRDVYILPIFLYYHKRNLNGKGIRFGKARAVVGDLIESKYFLDNYDCNSRHQAVMSHIYKLEKHLKDRFGEEAVTPIFK